MFTIQKTTRQLPRQRMTIKSFKHSEDMYKFLNKQTDNEWRESSLDLKAGVYAYAGGQWLNVKSIDPVSLCHF